VKLKAVPFWAPAGARSLSLCTKMCSYFRYAGHAMYRRRRGVGGGVFSSLPLPLSSYPSHWSAAARSRALAAGGACCLVVAASALSLLNSSASSPPSAPSSSACRGSMCEGSSSSKIISTYRHNAEQYYAKHGALPLPKTVHATLQLEQLDDANTKGNKNNNNAKNVLIIGDIHGCYDELMMLYDKAVQANGGVPFRAIITVGDLTAKGPKSVEVLRHFQKNSDRWYAVRGNNDDGTLRAALNDPVRMHQEKYTFVKDMNDGDVQFMAELPYTITIPSAVLEQDAGDGSEKKSTSGDDHDALIYNLDVRDTIIVHAGLITGKPLEEQDITTMILVRGLQKRDSADGPWEFYSFSKAKALEPDAVAYNRPAVGPTLWAKTWEGPQRVVFGHDAAIGLQQYAGDWALGIDTGAVYGGQLTGLILPRGEVVQVDAIAEHENVGLWANLAAKKMEKREEMMLKARGQGQ